MPLYIGGTRIEAPDDVDEFVNRYQAHFKESNQTLLSQEVSIVGPKELLYIGQREVAGTHPEDDAVSILGTEDATTCHIAVLRHSGSGAVSMIHFDGSSIKQGFESMVAIVDKLTGKTNAGRLEVHLVGGFLDDRKNSHDISNEVLNVMCNCPYKIHLVTACITHLNTVYKNKVPFPVIYGIACDVKTGEIFRATFPDKGPDMPLRGARHFGGGEENIEIYDPTSHQLVLKPFHYDQLPNIDRLVTLSDPFIRKYLSTSPEQEPYGFEASVRCSLNQIRDVPDPVNMVFQCKPRKYKKDKETGAWVLVQS